MDIKFISTFIKRWAWLIGLGLLAGILAGFIYSKSQTPIYIARTKIMFTQEQSSRPQGGSAAIDPRLAPTLTQLLVTQPVLRGTSEQLGYPVSNRRVTVEPLKNTQIIQVSVRDEDPDRAAEIANTLIKVFEQQNEALQSSRYAAEEQSLQEQINRVQEQINGLQNQSSSQTVESTDEQVQAVTKILADLDAEIRTLREDLVKLQFTGEAQQVWSGGRLVAQTPTPNIDQRVEIATKTDRLTELQNLRDMYQQVYLNLTFGAGTSGSQGSDQIRAALNLYQQIHSDLLNNLENIRLARMQNTANVTQVEAARPPSSASEPNTIFNMGLFGAIGLALAAIFAFVREFSDDRFHTLDEVSGVLPLPILGTISSMGRGKTHNGEPPYVLTHPRSPVAEAFRSLRSNLEFSNDSQPIRTLLVSSPAISEGKTTLAVNLAVIYAQAKKRVILVDADLRRPMVHNALGLSNHIGLSDLLSGDIDLSRALQPSVHERLSVITSGSLPLTPAEALESEFLPTTLTNLRAISDIVIIDGPPALLADAAILAKKVEGVLMVVQLKQTKAEDALLMLEEFKRAGARVFGVAVNQAPAKRGYDRYAQSDEAPNSMSRLQNRVSRFANRMGKPSGENMTNNPDWNAAPAQDASSPELVGHMEKTKTGDGPYPGKIN